LSVELNARVEDQETESTSWRDDGRGHVKATFNNTQVTITDNKGDVLCWARRHDGFKEAARHSVRQSMRAQRCAEKASKFGVKELEVASGPSSGRARSRQRNQWFDDQDHRRRDAAATTAAVPGARMVRRLLIHESPARLARVDRPPFFEVRTISRHTDLLPTLPSRRLFLRQRLALVSSARYRPGYASLCQ
jgi:ribosomal protein S11